MIFLVFQKNRVFGYSLSNKTWWKPCFVRQNQQKNNLFLRGDFRQLSNKNVQIWDPFFPLLSPKDSEYLKILDIQLQEVGAKRRLNGTSKVNRQTDKHTDRQTDISTYRKHGPRGPMLWKHLHLKKKNKYTHWMKIFMLTNCITVFFDTMLWYSHDPDPQAWGSEGRWRYTRWWPPENWGGERYTRDKRYIHQRQERDTPETRDIYTRHLEVEDR